MAVLNPFSLFIHVVFLLLSLHSGSPLVAGFVQGRNKTDHLALLAFKAAITSDPFGALNSWNESIHFCHWVGVTCARQHQRVIVLRLEHHELTGSVSPHVGNLSFLRELWLGNNSLSHKIPPELSCLRRLRILTMVNNSITGEIPTNISGCFNLVALELSRNRLVGKIPTELGSLTKLERLLIGSNNITGGLPSTLGNLSALTNLTAYYNSITGNIPDTLGACKKLEVLRLALNKFVGTFPSSIYNISSMRNLIVPYNQIEGSLPSDLGITLPNIQRLVLGANLFTGYIPISIFNATKLYDLSLGENRFKGKVPLLEKMRDLEVLLLHQNHLGTGEVDDLSFLNSLTNATKLRFLSLSENNFGGVLPESISNFSTHLMVLELGGNNIGGSIPTGIGNLINLQVLLMFDNHLSGNIIADIGKLQKLQLLSLNGNKFYGEIPTCLANLTSLSQLVLSENNLQGSIPSSLGECQLLQVLYLYRNNLSGIIPKEVMISISLLLALDLSDNNLSGNLPIDVGNLKNLEEFDASENTLSGRIPSTLGSSVKLRFLILGANKFWGNIPATLANLRGVEELNLSHNNFSGQIPEYLDGFIFLNTLDLSFNDFEGVVPERGVFKNATAISVEGNNKLCGGIAELQLHSCNSKNSRRKGLNPIGKLIILVSFGLLGLLVMLGVLYLCWSRRTTKVPSIRELGNSFPQLSYQSLLRATDGFSPSNLIGVGSFGSVYKGILDQSGKIVAVKVLNLQFRCASKSFKAECKAMKSIKHRNLVGILTACSSIDYHGNHFKALVYEFMVNGSLHEWLHPNGNGEGVHEELRSLNLLQRLHIAIDVASALDYLHHHCWEPIVHCDLKPSNILLDSEMTARVADFGLARFLLKATHESSEIQSSSIGMRGSIGYAAPEYGMGNEASTSGDVYSYGILLLEMFTGKRPTDGMFTDNLTLHKFAKMAPPESVESIFDRTLIPQGQIGEASTSINSIKNQSSLNSHKIHECLTSLLQVGIACSKVATDRPDINEVVTDLHKIKNILLGSRVHGG
ncbi:probable LRR receptor-like serine/threonine-protein kinase At3g47570 [Rhododendron vialii]|uniref:probable LRR receptor-like serine/threonine-protein kinase At3g47570 n=1 Tax=Rhododendron vialii TaxID=182163 RepID=UPI00265E9668|nr:probable LRR receptor-like serine/threonine-protein kinase At3g47570 [Rhododendron vialii]